MIRRLAAALALVAVAGSASAQFSDSLDPFNKGAVCGSACTVKLGQIAGWHFEEASGTRVDSVAGTYDLTAVNAPGNAAGKVGNAIQFVAASTQYATTAVNIPIASTDFTFSGWACLTTGGANRTVWFTNGATFASLNMSVLDTPRFNIGGTNLSASSNLTVGSCDFVVIRFTTASLLKEISVNNGTFATATSAVGPSAGLLRFGATFVPATPFNGRLDECGFWTRLLTAAEITYLYNGGAGRSIYAYLQDLWFPGLRYAAPAFRFPVAA